MIYLRMAWGALGAAGILTKLLVAAGLVAALLAAYGVWHHQVYNKGWHDALAGVARQDARAIAQGQAYRSKFKECRAAGQRWDQTTGKCT